MSTALTTTPATPGMPERFANPLQQVRGLMAQPAVRRSAPMAMIVGLVGAAALAWATLSTPEQKTLFTGLADADKAAVMQSLEQANIGAHVDEGTGAITVDEDAYSRARMLLASQGLPKQAPGGYAVLDQLPMGVSRAVEGERLRQARETELARSIQDIDAVIEARVHLATPEASVFVRDQASPSASVIVKLAPGRSLSDAQVASIVNLVASSVPGMKPDAVTIVDQAGALLTKPGGRDAASAVGDERIDFQRRVEDKYRQQLTQLLTPLLGAGNFSAEVQADVNLDETQATRESYEKQGALRAETGQWTGNQKDGGAPGGIPGALSNTPPPASMLQVPTPAVGASGGPQPVAGGPAPDANKQSDSYQRAYDLGREVSVTRAAPGSVKRLSVAVVLREPEKGRRTQMEINQITDLVKSAVGFDQQRQDNVTVISRQFAGAATDMADSAPWYDNSWLPMLARNLTAILIALMVLLLGVRPIAKALVKKKEEVDAPRPDAAVAATDASGAPLLGEDGQPLAGMPMVAPPVSLDQMQSTKGYDERIDVVRGFTRDNPARAALAVRDMIKADSK